MKTEFFELMSADLSSMHSVEIAAHSHPWTLSTLSSCFSRLYFNIGIKLNNKFAGFAIVQQVVDEATLMDICVSPILQGQGVGKQLLIKVIEQARQRQASVIMLEVRESNVGAIKLYQQQGFIETCRRSDYYPTVQGREDAIMMELRFAEP
ncbi:MAG: ribosomal protein S18-alanine N-acetyltransferase [Parashewanella sp.]